MELVSENGDCRTQTDGGVITVTFTRQAKRNAVNAEMFDALASAVDALETQDDLKVMVIASEGPFFTAGIDISLMRPTLGEDSHGVVRGSIMRRQYRGDARHDLFDRFEMVEKPVMMAVQGACLGVGVEFGASCDLRIASDAASFGLPEVQHLAVIPGSGGISRLTRLVGPHWAKYLVMTGRPITAQQALQIGLVHEVHPVAEFATAVRALADSLAVMPGEALGLAKVTIDTAAEVDRRTAREIDRMAQTLLFTSPDHQERVQAFLGRGK